MQGQWIKEVTNHKYLGIHVSPYLKWSSYWLHSKESMDKNQCHEKKFQVDRKTLEIIFMSFIRSILEYGDVLFDNCTQHEKLELEKIQYEAGRKCYRHNETFIYW